MCENGTKGAVFFCRRKLSRATDTKKTENGEWEREGKKKRIEENKITEQGNRTFYYRISGRRRSQKRSNDEKGGRKKLKKKKKEKGKGKESTSEIK